MKKVSILIPTYNDEKFICDTLDSIFNQKWQEFEVLICDDGSTDNTKKIIKEYKQKKDPSDKIKYFYQDNADQLNALITLIPEITGDYVYILHSDDLLNNKVLEKMVNYMEENLNVESIIGDITIIDKKGSITGVQKVDKYKKSKNTIALQLLWLGRNLYVDMAFHRKSVFTTKVYQNYLLWNGPFWLNLDDDSMLNVEKVNFSFFKYRIFEDNYLNTNGANFNVINGEIRVVTRLLKNYEIPAYKLQYTIYRIFNKIGLKRFYHTFYRKRESHNKYKIIKFVLHKRFSYEEISNNLFLNALLSFYKNNTQRAIQIEKINEINLYYGKDMRIFNKKIIDGSIEESYKNIFKEMGKGFNEIIIDNSDYYDIAVNLTKFLCIYPYVKITVRRKRK